MSQSETIRGTVTATNDAGLKIDSHGGWLNYTTQRPLPRAAKGDQVVLTVSPDQEGIPKWINAIEIASTQPAPQSNGHTNGGGLAERDGLMARCSALKSATTLATSGGDQGAPRSIDVLAVATLYSSWLLGTVTDDQVQKLANRSNGQHTPPAESIPF